jgi:hypothetical protein
MEEEDFSGLSDGELRERARDCAVSANYAATSQRRGPPDYDAAGRSYQERAHRSYLHEAQECLRELARRRENP